MNLNRSTVMTRSRARWVVMGSLLAFWVGLFQMASVADGYVSQRDYVSSLAARGSSVWVGGELLLVLFAIATAATAAASWQRWRSHAVMLLLALSSLAVVAVAAFRAGCPRGEARCDIGTDVPPGDWVATAHGVAAGSWLLLMIAAMAVVAAGLSGRRPWPRWLAVVSIPLALAALAFSGGADGGPHTGLWQRLWLASASVWLLLVTVAATTPPPTLDPAAHEPAGGRPT